MIQLTKWLMPNDITKYKNKDITVMQWCEIFAEEVENRTNRTCCIKNKLEDGIEYVAVFKNKIGVKNEQRTNE